MFWFVIEKFCIAQEKYWFFREKNLFFSQEKVWLPRAALRLSEAPWAEELEAVEEYPILQDTDQDLQIPGSVDSVEEYPILQDTDQDIQILGSIGTVNEDLQSFKITDSR